MVVGKDEIPGSTPALRYAAIDIGTVTCRLLVADLDCGILHELEKGYAITNLGEGVDATGCLQPQAMKRVADQLVQFQKRIDAHQDSGHPSIEVIVTATSAARDAHNASEFLGMLRSLGLEPAIISGKKEAALSFLGVGSSFPGERLLVIDIGGGSTEISAGTAGQEPFLSRSMDVGCRRMTERFFHSDPPGEEELGKARSWAEGMLEAFFNDLGESGFSVDRMVAVAGTATSAVAIQKELQVYDSAQVHGSTMSKEELARVFDGLRTITLAQRKKVVGLDPGRADVIVAGLAILGVALGLAGQEYFTVSESDVLQGIILDRSIKRAH